MTLCISAFPDPVLAEQPPDGSGALPAADDQDRIQMDADLVHDLSNMLTIVLGSLDLLQRQPLNRAAQRQLGRAQWSAGRAGELARHMLIAARPVGSNTGTPSHSTIAGPQPAFAP